VNSGTNQFVLNGSAGNIIAGTGGLLKAGSSTLTVNAPNTFSGGSVIREGTVNITQAGALGAGTVTLGDASTGSGNTALYLDAARTSYTNAVTVSSNGNGTATLGSRSNIAGTGDNNQFTNITLARDVIFDSNAADRTDYENISGTGNITITGTGRTVFSTTANFTGDITVNLGTGLEATFQTGVATAGNQNYIPDGANLTVNDTPGNATAEYRLSSGGESINALLGNGTVDVNSISGTLTIGTAGGGGTFSGVLQNGGASVLSLTKTGSGTQILTGANTNTGATTISGGVLQVGNGGSAGQLGSGAVSLAAGTTLAFNRTGAIGQAGALNSAVAGAGTFNVSGDATTAVSLNAGGNFSGVVNINDGALVAGATNPWGTHLTAPSFNVAAGASLAFGSGSAHAHIGALNLNGGSVTTVPGGTNSYDGENFQLNGDVTVAGTTPSTITRDVARTDANSGIALRGVRTFTVGDVTGSPVADLLVTTELENPDAGVIGTAGPGGIIKAGAGTMSLSGTHSYTGPTTVSGGTLHLEAGSSIAASSLLTVNPGGTLSGTGTAGAVALAGGTLSPGASPGILTTGSITTSSSSTVLMELGGLTAGAQYDQIQTSGTISLDGTLVLTVNYQPSTGDKLFLWLNDSTDPITGTFTGLAEGGSILYGQGQWIISYNDDSGNTLGPSNNLGNDVSIIWVPEPGTSGLALLAGCIALGRRRRAA
jgi:autotransporter-associated beta strand protein